MASTAKQTALPLVPSVPEHLDISALETWLWDAACAIRGATDAPKFKDFILPLVFYKRLSDVFDDEFSERAAEFGDEATAREVIEADHADALKSGRKPIVRSFILDTYCWKAIGNHLAERYRRRFVTDAVREVPVRIPTFNACSTSRTTGSTRAANATLDC